MRTNHRILAGVMGGLLVLGAAACTDDDQTIHTTGTTVEPIGQGESTPDPAASGGDSSTGASGASDDTGSGEDTAGSGSGGG
jgi:hypothetical protein